MHGADDFTEYSAPDLWSLKNSDDIFVRIKFLRRDLGACVIGFIFARALRYARKQPLAFGFAVTSGLTLAVLLIFSPN